MSTLFFGIFQSFFWGPHNSAQRLPGRARQVALIAENLARKGYGFAKMVKIRPTGVFPAGRLYHTKPV